jgi:anaerobic selenocysteine-containing dehydrogenase
MAQTPGHSVVNDLSQAVATRVVHAVCSHDCPDSCGVLVTIEAAPGTGVERAVKIQGDPAHPVTRGFLCGKVAKYLDRVYSPGRLLYPMRRRAGVPKGPVEPGQEDSVFERISWDEALELIAGRLTKIAAEFGPESVLPYSYAGTIGQLGYGSMDRRFFHRLGASQLDRTICASAGGAALLSVYGTKLGTAPEDFAHAGLVIAWGANIHGNNIHLWPFIEEARRAGAKLIVIDPYRTRTAALADEHLAIHPGTDTLLALSMMHVILSEGLEDKAYVAAATCGFEELRAHALRAEHAPEAAAAVTGIAAETIVRLARAYANCARTTGRPAVIRLNYGIQRSETGGAGGVYAAAADRGVASSGWRIAAVDVGIVSLQLRGAADAGVDAGEFAWTIGQGGQHERAGAGADDAGGDAGSGAAREGAVCLQLESRGGGTQPERGAARDAARGSVHGGA